MNKIADIQGLRALAVVSVIAYHLDVRYFQFGYLGVDIFLVISGYLISNIFLSKQINHKNILNYFNRRICRLGPALLVNILLFIFILYYLNPPVHHSNIQKNILAALIALSNLYFYNTANYFDDTNSINPFLHLWSVSLEIQFYLLAPLFFFFAVKYRNKLRYFIFVFLISLLVYMYMLFFHEEAQFYLLPGRFWQFSMGILISRINIMPSKLVESKIIYYLRIASLALIFLILGNNLIEINAELCGFFVTIFTGIYLIYIEYQPKNRIMSNGLFLFIGEISYSLYLNHYLIINIFRNNFSQFANHSGFSFFLIFLILITGYLSYSLIEKPFISSKLDLVLKMKIIIGFYGFCFIIALTVFGGIGSKMWWQIIPSSEQKMNLNLISKYAFQNLSENRIRPNRCFYFSEKLDKKFLDQFDKCTTKDKKVVLLIGDSHALNIHNIFARQFSDSSFFTLAKPGCRPYENEKCFYNDLPDFIEKHSSGVKRVIYHQSGGHLLQNLSSEDLSEAEYNSNVRIVIENTEIHSILNFLDILANLTEVYWLGPFTEAQKNLNAPHNWYNNTQISANTKNKFALLDDAISEKSYRYDTIKYISTYNVISANRDYIYTDNCLLWNDLDHLSLCGEEIIADSQKKFLAGFID